MVRTNLDPTSDSHKGIKGDFNVVAGRDWETGKGEKGNSPFPNVIKEQ
ncbi:MAG: hypothetical protein AAGC93_17670 [Cyanobacteria bacterium P01_F01_bin.53]